MKKKIFLILTCIFSIEMITGCGNKNPWDNTQVELGDIKESEDSEKEYEENSNNTKTQLESNESTIVSEIEKIDFPIEDNYKGKTIFDLTEDYPELESMGYQNVGNELYKFILSAGKNAYNIEIIAECNANEVEKLGDFLDRETEDYFPIAKINSFKIIDNATILKEVEKYIKQPVLNMVNDGYYIDGYVYYGTTVELYLKKNEQPMLYVNIGDIQDFDTNNYKNLYLNNIIKSITVSTNGF